MAKLSDLHNAIVKGNLELAVSTTQEALQENIDPQTLISDYLIKGMEEIGTQFEAGKAYVPNLFRRPARRALGGAGAGRRRSVARLRRRRPAVAG